MSRVLGALDLGSGTIKLSVFQQTPDGRYAALCLDEANTELRRGMGPERTLKPGPLAETLAACDVFLEKAKELGLERLPAYATSAVRKAVNPHDLLGPLRARGVETRVLGEEDEGRWNLLGARCRLAFAGGLGMVPPPQARLSDETGELLVVDPGGDSTECTADVDARGWERATVASLPFGSVSLQEAFGSEADNAPIEWGRLARAADFARQKALEHPAFHAFPGRGLTPALRMNAPIQRALEQVAGRTPVAHGEGGLYRRRELEVLTRHLAGLDHAGRGRLLEGEPIGKVDRTCYGFASWLGILGALGTDPFLVEPWGIKLGAAVALNP